MIRFVEVVVYDRDMSGVKYRSAIRTDLFGIATAFTDDSPSKVEVNGKLYILVSELGPTIKILNGDVKHRAILLREQY